jgi:hypothetical protein
MLIRWASRSVASRGIIVTDFRTIKGYEYRDAASLLADFWNMVDAVLRERGVIS